MRKNRRNSHRQNHDAQNASSFISITSLYDDRDGCETRVGQDDLLEDLVPSIRSPMIEWSGAVGGRCLTFVAAESRRVKLLSNFVSSQLNECFAKGAAAISVKERKL